MMVMCVDDKSWNQMIDIWLGGIIKNEAMVEVARGGCWRERLRRPSRREKEEEEEEEEGEGGLGMTWNSRMAVYHNRPERNAFLSQAPSRSPILERRSYYRGDPPAVLRLKRQ